MDDQKRERRQRLAQKVSDWLNVPMAILAVMWLVVIVDELVVSAHGPAPRTLSIFSVILWLTFLLAFLIELLVAADKRAFIKKNWLFCLSSVLPFLAVFRALTALRALWVARGAFGAVLASRRLKTHSYLVQVIVTMSVVVVMGAASTYNLESGSPRSDFPTFGYTVYWAACMVTTVNFGPEPTSVGGRVIALVLRICGVAFFGYVAGGLASAIFGVRLTR
jgi:hypothetical protein